MGTTDSRERKILFILNRIKTSRTTFLDKKHFTAVCAVELYTTERTIVEIIGMLERAKKIDVRIWK